MIQNFGLDWIFKKGELKRKLSNSIIYSCKEVHGFDFPISLLLEYKTCYNKFNTQFSLTLVFYEYIKIINFVNVSMNHDCTLLRISLIGHISHIKRVKRTINTLCIHNIQN